MLRSSKGLLAAAAACAGGFVVLLAVAYGWGLARWADGAALDGLIELRSALDAALLSRVVQLADPAPYALAGLAIAAWALSRGRPRHAAAVVALLATTAVASQALQVLLAHPRPHSLVSAQEIASQAFPSGHATAAMSLALAAVIAAPAAWRATTAALGALFALAIGGSVVALGWHFPSDVLGGYLLAAGTALGLCAALRAANARWPERAARTAAASALARSGPALVAATASAAAGAFALPRLTEAAEYAAHHTSAVLAWFVLALAAIALSASVALARD